MYNASGLSIVIHVRAIPRLMKIDFKNPRDEGKDVPASPGRLEQTLLERRGKYDVIFADVINSTHTGCLSHFSIEGAELSILENSREIGEKTALLQERRK